MKKLFSLALLTLTFGAAASAQAASVSFVEPKDGATVPSEFTVKFAVEGMAVKPAGDLAKETGHHHLIVDGKSIPAGQVVPTDANHIHFGKGQTETKVKLAPGKHTLTMQFANGAHQSYGEAMSSTITVTVK